MRSGTFRESRVDQNLLQLDFGLPRHPQRGHVETLVLTEMSLRLLAVDPATTEVRGQRLERLEVGKLLPPVTTFDPPDVVPGLEDGQQGHVV